MCRSQLQSSNKSFALRRVNFSTSNTFSSTVNASRLHGNDSIWYTQVEIESFKNDAKMFSRALRHQNARRKRKCGYSSLEMHPSKTLCIRGLETRIDSERIRQRRTHMRKVINAQKIFKFLTPVEREGCLAMISYQESFSAKCKALVEGSFDAEII